jgi:hypothetical protein
MASKGTKSMDALHLTPEEAESMGVALPVELVPSSLDLREKPLQEQVGWSLTEEDMTELLAGEVTAESREDVSELFADLQEEEADRSSD